MFRVRTPLRRGVLHTTLCDKVYQWLAAGQWFSPVTQVSSTNKTLPRYSWNLHIVMAVWLNHFWKSYCPFSLKNFVFVLKITFTLITLFFQFVGGELGGKNACIKWTTSFLLFSLWIVYIVLSSLRAYNIITW